MRLQLRLSRGYIRVFLFLGCIRISQWVTRVNPVVGDWVADRLGVTAAYQRAHRAVLELRPSGNVN